MADINTLDQGAKILQNVDVSSIVTGLALGIADAQERLDNNSVSQLIRLSETKVAGKSLLEFGFQPAFYAFEYADVSASIQLKMAIKEEVEVDFSLAVDYQNNTTFDKEFFNQLEKNKSKSLSKYSKTQKTVALKAKTSKNVSVNQSSFEIHKEEGSYSKVEKAKEQMRDETNELRAESVIEDSKILEENSINDVYIAKEGGYVVITEPYIHTDVEGLLKLSKPYNSTATTITLKGGNSSVTFDKITDFDTTLNDARTKNGGTVIGINSEGIHRTNGKKILEFYFGWDRFDMDYNYSNTTNADALNEDDVTALAMLLKRDSSLNIIVKGYTDGSGSDSAENTEYNKVLGTNRASSFRDALSKIAGVKFSDSRVKPDTQGETLANGSSSKDKTIRKITIEFEINSPDYILFNGGQITATGSSPKTDTSPDYFVYVEASNSTANTSLPITFKYGGITYVLRDSSSNNLSSLTNNKGKYQELYIEKVNESYYLLHEDTKINYFIHSKENKEIEVKVENEALAQIDKDKTDIYVSETSNDTSKLKESAKDFEGDRSLAISGSLDVRYARQFGVSVEGNASVSARMISVPPPTGLENYIESLTGNSTSGN